MKPLYQLSIVATILTYFAFVFINLTLNPISWVVEHRIMFVLIETLIFLLTILLNKIDNDEKIF